MFLSKARQGTAHPLPPPNLRRHHWKIWLWRLNTKTWLRICIYLFLVAEGFRLHGQRFRFILSVYFIPFSPTISCRGKFLLLFWARLSWLILAKEIIYLFIYPCYIIYLCYITLGMYTVIWSLKFCFTPSASFWELKGTVGNYWVSERNSKVLLSKFCLFREICT